MSDTNFVIVTFVDENDAIGIVATNWIKPEGNTCYYPNVRTEEMKNKLLRRMAEPEHKIWPQYKIKILKRYETYGEARLHLKKAEDTSNLDSDDEVRKRKRKTKKMYLPEDSDSSDGYGYPIAKAKAQKLEQKNKSDCLKYPAPPKPSAEQTIEAIEADIVEASQAVNCLPATCVPAEAIIEADIVEAGPSSAITIPSASKNTDEYLPEMPDLTGSKKMKKCQPFSNHNQAVNCPSGCVISKQFAIQQCHLIQVVTDLSNQVIELNRKVDLLLGRSAEPLHNLQTEDAFAVPDFLTNLPVKDDASFCYLNEQLEMSQNQKAIIKYLAGIGGRNVRSLTTNMLRRILLDDVAELYSLTGKQMKNSTKKPFITTETYKIIFRICKKSYDDITEEKIKEITSD